MNNSKLISILIGILIGSIGTFGIMKIFFPEKTYSALPDDKELVELPKSEIEATVKSYKEFADQDPCNYPYAINVSKQQYELLRQSVERMTPEELREISGFRLYFGRGPGNILFSFAYQIDNSFLAVKPRYGVLASNFMPKEYEQECPPFCNYPDELREQ
ncbi:MAG: hypothetical protein ACM3PT_07360 [Deltaproteobacteria bacterium]